MSRGPSYAWPQRAIHWLVAACVICTVPLGWYIAGYEKAAVDAANEALGPGGFDMLYDLHKSIGLTILGLMILRVIFRATLGAPGYARPLSGFDRAASGAVHAALYLLLIVTPVVGWVGVSAYPAPAPFWFLADLRLPVEDRGLSDTLLQDVHGPLAFLVVILAGVHILAALKHRLVNRDEVMGRMLG